jgi:NADP-reducing hydrogenase subunit HndB
VSQQFFGKIKWRKNMTKIKTLADLKKMKEEVRSKITLREQGDNPEDRVQVKVAMATCGIASGAKDVMDFMVGAFNKRGIDAVVTQTGCMGYCYAEPTVEVTVPGKEPVVFGYVDVKKADEIIEKYIKKGILLEGIIPVNYQTIE